MKPLIISVGEPAGIGPEVVFKSLPEHPDIPIVIVCDWELTRQQLDLLGIPFDEKQVVTGVGGLASGHTVLDLAISEGATLSLGAPDAISASAALRAIDVSIELMSNGIGRALVTGPVSKSVIATMTDAGGSFIGHTEHLARAVGLERYGRDFAMMFDSPTLTTILASTHVPLREAIASLEVESLLGLIRLSHESLERLGRAEPRLAIAGVNPHAGEGGMFGDEDALIDEAVRRARAESLDVTGPLPADTVFHAAALGRYDAVVAIYHDQGLIPVKTLHFQESVNVTIGLPWLRASVDHGTALDIAGKNEADHRAMSWAIDWADSHAGREV